MLYAVALAILLRALGITLTQPFLVAGVEIPLLPSIYQAVKLLSQAAIPVFMLVLGMQLGNNGGKEAALSGLFWPTVAASVTRLLLSPAIAWGIATLVGLQGIALRAAVLEAAMPSAILNVILAIEFNARPKFVSMVVVVTTLASMVTITLLLSLW
jgi:predicted permease